MCDRDYLHGLYQEGETRLGFACFWNWTLCISPSFSLSFLQTWHASGGNAEETVWRQKRKRRGENASGVSIESFKKKLLCYTLSFCIASKPVNKVCWIGGSMHFLPTSVWRRTGRRHVTIVTSRSLLVNPKPDAKESDAQRRTAWKNRVY